MQKFCISHGTNNVECDRYLAQAKWKSFKDRVSFVIARMFRISDRRVFKTGRGLAGLGAKTLRIGDIVVFLFGR